MSQNLYAFWKYDTFPFMLGGEITGIRDDGFVAPISYGGCLVRPFKILSLRQGKELREKLVKLEIEKEKEMAKINSEFQEKLKTLKKQYFVE